MSFCCFLRLAFFLCGLSPICASASLADVVDSSAASFLICSINANVGLASGDWVFVGGGVAETGGVAVRSFTGFFPLFAPSLVGDI